MSDFMFFCGIVFVLVVVIACIIGGILAFTLIKFLFFRFKVWLSCALVFFLDQALVPSLVGYPITEATTPTLYPLYCIGLAAVFALPIVLSVLGILRRARRSAPPSGPGKLHISE